MASIRELHREAASHGYPKTNCFIRPLSSTTSPTAGMCRTQAPGPDRPPGGLPSGVWYTPAAAPLPAGAGEEARGPLDSGSPPLSQPASEIRSSSGSGARTGITLEIGLFRSPLTF